MQIVDECQEEEQLPQNCPPLTLEEARLTPAQIHCQDYDEIEGTFEKIRRIIEENPFEIDDYFKNEDMFEQK